MNARQNITQLEQTHHKLYAPNFRVEVGEIKDLLVQKQLEVVSVQVDQTLEGADQFSFVINNGFDIENRELLPLLDLFKFGSAAKIFMGYSDMSDLELMISGPVTSISTSFPASGLPQITVSGFDHSYCMLKGKRSDSWDKKTNSQVVSLVARRNNLSVSAEDSKVRHPKIVQHQESEYQLLERLAERNGFELYVRDKTLHFAPPANAESGVIVLEWGAGLLSFTPELNINEQLTEVNVVGWNVDQKKEIVGTAKVGDEVGRDRGRKSGGEYLRGICKEATSLRIRLPVYSQQQANAWARAILKRRSEGFVKGSGESIGLPELKPDKNIEMRGLGALFSKPYYIEQCTHTISTAGYTTSFQVKESTA